MVRRVNEKIFLAFSNSARGGGRVLVFWTVSGGVYAAQGKLVFA